MKCIILAAGYATRLYPLTENFPKPLLKVGEKTIVDWLIDDVRLSGQVDMFVVVTNHKYAANFFEWAKDKRDVKVIDDGTVDNAGRLGAVRDIQLALDECGIDEDILVLAGDNVLDFSLNSFIGYSARKKTGCAMRYFEPEKAKISKSAMVIVDENDLILRMEEKPAAPESNWCVPPFYYYTRDDAASIKDAIAGGCPVDAPGNLLSWMAARRKVHCMEMPGRRYDIGNLESYEKVQREYKGIIK